jgi:hypothetical protein
MPRITGRAVPPAAVATGLIQPHPGQQQAVGRKPGLEIAGGVGPGQRERLNLEIIHRQDEQAVALAVGPQG